MKMTKLSSLGTLRNGINYNKASAKKGCKIIGVADFGNRVFPDYSTLAEIDASIVSEAKSSRFTNWNLLLSIEAIIYLL